MPERVEISPPQMERLLRHPHLIDMRRWGWWTPPYPPVSCMTIVLCDGIEVEENHLWWDGWCECWREMIEDAPGEVA